jgi:uncharacterized lipoprotein YddW (UPF0748 family)
LTGVKEKHFYRRFRWVMALFALAAFSCTPMHREKKKAEVSSCPPPLNREFRGAWIASVANIDWPSKPGLPADQQKAEAIRILDTLVRLHMNVAILQVRTSCDALYDSKLEPWAYYITGTQGKSPGYDPLEFWVAEAHKRGIELHAWINPFRAKQAEANYTTSMDHVSHTHPDWIITYANEKESMLWLDPGNPAATQHSFDVVMDIVKRYDIDGVHIDDYFYPYPIKDKNGDTVPFDDGASYTKYWAAGGRLKLDDWRRQNINNFIQRIYKGIHAEKKWVKFGISPFGMWRPGNPPGTAGFDGYAEIYCDSRLWWRKGWCDYIVPQVYWKISAMHSNYLTILDWWKHENWHDRVLVAGMYTGLLDTKDAVTKKSRNDEAPKWTRDEIGDQIGAARVLKLDGQVHFPVHTLVANAQKIDDLLVGEKKPADYEKSNAALYEQGALVPASARLDDSHPSAPSAHAEVDQDKHHLHVSWAIGEGGSCPPAWQFAVQMRSGSDWMLHVYPGNQTQVSIFEPKLKISEVAVYAVDRCGVASKPTIIKIEK